MAREVLATLTQKEAKVFDELRFADTAIESVVDDCIKQRIRVVKKSKAHWDVLKEKYSLKECEMRYDHTTKEIYREP